MTTFYSAQTKGKLARNGAPVSLMDASLVSGKLHALFGSIHLNEETVLSGDTIVWGALPKLAVPLIGFLTSSVSLGSSTLDVGITGTAAKFRAAAVFTAVDTPTPFMKAIAMGVPLVSSTRVQSIIAAANMPTSDNYLDFALFYTLPHSG